MTDEETLRHTKAIIRSTPERWIWMAETYPSELLLRSPAEGEWSALGCLMHLLDTERMVFPVRLQAFLRGEDFRAFDPDSEGTKPAGEPSLNALVREFAALRETSMALIEQVTEADLDRQAHHEELGRVTLREMFNEWAGHDLMHTVQAERALMQPFIEGCGPWRSYFSDHIAARK